MTFSLLPALAAKLYQALLAKDVWEQGESVDVGEEEPVVLPVPIVKRARQQGKAGVRFEFINSSKKVDEGHFGSVWKVLGTLQEDKFKAAGSLNKAGQAKERVIKIQKHYDSNPPGNAPKEYRLARLSNQLHIKIPTIVQGKDGLTCSYITMRCMQGENLSTILKNKHFTPKQAFELSIALLQALKHQVTDRGILHRDLKPENIMVNLHTNPITVSILDFGLSIDARALDGKNPGNPFYAAPELFSGDAFSQNHKVDVYPMARIIALLWGVSRHSYNNFIEGRSVEDMLTGLLQTVSGLSDVQKNGIRYLLTLGHHPDPDQRISLDHFLEDLQYLSQNPLVTKAPEPGPSVTPPPPPVHTPSVLSRDIFSRVMADIQNQTCSIL